jgi:LysM repeat protein
VTPVPTPTPTTEPVPTKAPEADKSDTIYNVVEGDTLSKIARKYGTNWQALAQYNHLKNPDLIFPDQKIMIPSK